MPDGMYFEWEYNEWNLQGVKAKHKRGEKLETWELRLLVNEQEQEDRKKRERTRLKRKLRK